jgi:uncharacterized protein
MPRVRQPRNEDGRRLWSAGHAVVVTWLGLVLASLLNAPGMHKTAFNQEQGLRRDVALAVTGPLAGLSGALQLDRPRQLVKATLGRSDDDEIDTAVAAPQPKPTTPVVVPETPADRVKFTPKRKLGIWIAGDSLVIVPGESLLRAIAGNRAVGAVDGIDGRIASGLERPDVFNWFTHIRDVMEEDRPRAVVLMFGGNDDHGFMTGIPEGKEVGTFGSPTWRAEYRRRVAGVMDTVTSNGAYLVWIGLPISRDAEQTLRFDVINTIVQREAAKRAGRVSYLDTYYFFAGKDGGFAQYIEDSAGKLVKMRAEDGVHFERPAGDLIAAKVRERLEERYDFTSWRGGG